MYVRLCPVLEVLIVSFMTHPKRVYIKCTSFWFSIYKHMYTHLILQVRKSHYWADTRRMDDNWGYVAPATRRWTCDVTTGCGTECSKTSCRSKSGKNDMKLINYG